ncbi:aminoglycoside phosphotransferase family protein [Glycomyces buryatensis]|uniref:Aminoglycoside phosphotransferase family protein n=1 Tax=Glycomyces buryatensis TaxID=2570927 RepID=A0A4S8QED7_9ACTN|nr:aminoglycoside phosphotransferase family protein [Glycomyces buryatensis]THV42768.1 aminoglycoside phosphotransferase family protein [Glycomyces buryatensis]
MTEDLYADGRAGLDAEFVQRLVASQFPQWGDLPVEPVKIDGWDNRTYRLGEEMTVRLPSADAYALAVEKEHRWLPVLAEQLPVEIPTPLGIGRPENGYPHQWAVRRWIDGETADPSVIADLPSFAEAVAGFITALQAADATGGPGFGPHNFYRGASPGHYDPDTREALRGLKGRIDTAAATEVWEAALASTWDGEPVWFHGDIAHGNLLTREGKLSAVIDFGTSGVGDPACDLVIAWTMFEGESREAFRRAVAQDDATWARARGWAIWKALIMLHAADDDPTFKDIPVQRRVIEAVIADHEAHGRA